MTTNLIIIAKEREVKVKIRNLLIVTPILLVFIIPGCKTEKTKPIEMVAVPSLELLSDKSIGKDSSQKIQIALESFYISNEITNKEYREFTDWVNNNPEKILAKSKEIKGLKNETEKTRVWTVPVFIVMADLLPKVIDHLLFISLIKTTKTISQMKSIMIFLLLEFQEMQQSISVTGRQILKLSGKR